MSAPDSILPLRPFLRAACRLGALAAAAVLLALAAAADARAASRAGDSVCVAVQVSGPFRERTYLVWDPRTRAAALVDPGSEVDRLVDTLASAGLTLRYVLLTHGHQDHVASLSAVRARFPGARLGYSARELASFADYARWRTLFDSVSVATWDGDPAARALMDLDYGALPAPDRALEDGQVLRLGGLRIRVLETPGHSPGGLAFAVGGHLFPGDLILYHATGDMECPLVSRERIVRSIRRLYALFPAATPIHAGHGADSTIGDERRGNRNVTATAVRWAP